MRGDWQSLAGSLPSCGEETLIAKSIITPGADIYTVCIHVHVTAFPIH